MKKYFVLVLMFIFQPIIECTGSEITNKNVNILSIMDPNHSEEKLYYKNLPTLSDFETRYKERKVPTDQMKLQYCDLLSHTLSDAEAFKRKDLIETCKYIGERIDKINLSEEEKCRAFVLGVLLSTSREQEQFFTDKLASVDPNNAFVTAMKLKESILYGNIEQTEELIRQFIAQDKFDLYIQQGYQNQYNIWISLFGENLQSFHSLQRKQHKMLLNKKIWEYVSLFWRYDTEHKYQNTTFVENGIPPVKYFSLDQLFLYKAKMSWEDFDWYALLTNIQLKCFYRLYHDSSLYYASGINVPIERTSGADVKIELERAKQYWLSKRNELQGILYDQRKEIYDLVKIGIRSFLIIESIDPKPDNKFRTYLKLYVQGKEMEFLNNLNDYDPNQPNNLVIDRLLPLIEKEKQFWKVKLSEKQEEAKIDEEPAMKITFD